MRVEFRGRRFSAVPPVFRMATGVGQGHDQDLVAINPVDDSVGKAFQQLAAVASANGFPKLGKCGDLVAGFSELLEESGGDVSGAFVVKRHCIEDFQLGFEQVMDSHRFRMLWTFASISSLAVDGDWPDFQRATR